MKKRENRQLYEAKVVDTKQISVTYVLVINLSV